jgi:hypothetical protein
MEKGGWAPKYRHGAQHKQLYKYPLDFRSQSLRKHRLAMSEVTTTIATEEPHKVSAPLYPLIEFPEGIDLNDFYCQVRIAMVMAHVFSLIKLS